MLSFRALDAFFIFVGLEVFEFIDLVLNAGDNNPASILT